MRAFMAAGLACLCCAGGVAAQQARWITFKTGRDSWGRIEHQIDAESIRSEGPYRIFWSRVWVVEKKQPLVFTANEALLAVAHKYVADCARRRFGNRFVDSNDPAEARHKTRLAAMRGETLDSHPAPGRAVCGLKS